MDVLARLITFFILMLLHTISKLSMYGSRYILTDSLLDTVSRETHNPLTVLLKYGLYKMAIEKNRISELMPQMIRFSFHFNSLPDHRSVKSLGNLKNTYQKIYVNHVTCAITPPGIKTSWRRRNDVSLYVPAASQIRPK